MNLSKWIKVTKKEFDNYIEYVRNSGYTIVIKDGNYNFHDKYGKLTIDFSAYVIRVVSTGRIERSIMIRIPHATENRDV